MVLGLISKASAAPPCMYVLGFDQVVGLTCFLECLLSSPSQVEPAEGARALENNVVMAKRHHGHVASQTHRERSKGWFNSLQPSVILIPRR